MVSKSRNLFAFWGKTDRSDKPSNRYHPVICHMIDVGIVAEELAAVTRFQFGNFHVHTIAFLCAMHDIGKFSPGFQSKDDAFTGLLKESGYSFPKYSEGKHGLIAARSLPDILFQAGCHNEDLADLLAYILSAHHGIFPNAVGFTSDVIPDDERWNTVRHDAMQLLCRIFSPSFTRDAALPPIADSIRLAGFLTVSDWLASNEDYFPYSASRGDDLGGIVMESYVAERRELAAKILDALHIGTTLKGKKTFFEMFQFPQNDCQKAITEITQELTHPMLIIVETPMGSGKTEAALEAYSHIALKNKLRGMYYALPTQATSNAMFGRVESFIEKLDLSGKTEFHLLHAASDINPEYDKLRVRSIGDDSDTSPGGGVYASSWFAGRKRGVLADFGVGTIDQALMSVLKNRHFFVRSFGLSDKVVILDEVHAYDAYMTEEISCLVKWLLKQNTSVIILSATLPESKRTKIIGKAVGEMPAGIKYPCVLGTDTTGRVVYRSLAGMDQVPVIMKPLMLKADDELKMETIKRLLDERLAEGGCAACILNTVSGAQLLYKLIKDSGSFDDVILFHGRFTVNRKTEIEKYIRSRYGRQGDGVQRPERGLVIATQVLEQSLDVDFDLMISDLAPIDLLLQRAGRLHRHNNTRLESLQERALYVLIPDMDREKPCLGANGFVYFPAILASTALLFFNEKNGYCPIKVKIPDDVSTLIEKVYGTDWSAIDGLPFEDTFRKWSDEREGKELGQSYTGKQNTLGDPDDDVLSYLSMVNNTWDEDTVAPSRLTKPSVQLVVISDDEQLEAFDKKDEKALFGRIVVTSHNTVVRHFIDGKDTTPEWWNKSSILRNCRPLVLQKDGYGLDLGEVMIMYDDDYGLRVLEKKGGTNG